MNGPGVHDSFAALTDGQLNTRIDRLTSYLDAWGDLVVSDTGRDEDRRLLEFALEAPGVELPTEVKVLFREYYRRLGAGEWNIAKYHYEYLDVSRSKRLAYHLHDVGRRRLVPHAHCEDATTLPGRDERDGPHHLRAVALDLREAHVEFMRLWAAGRAPDCARFLPLELPREP